MTNAEACKILREGDWFWYLPDEYTGINSELAQAVWLACSALSAEEFRKELQEKENKYA